jgi:F-type H+-transporting ATPase subunit epsilon
MTLHVELVSPESILLSADASMVVARTIGGGDIAFLTDHAPFVGALDVWPLEVVLTDGTTERAAVHGGFISVTDNQVMILSDLAELASQVDVVRAQTAAERAESVVQQQDDAEAEGALARAHARLRVAGVVT